MIAAAIAIASTGQQPVELYRQFSKGESLKYQVRSSVVIETKQGNMAFFMPETMDMNYDARLTVKEIKADGFADVEYRRPTITIVEGETANSPQRTVKQKVDFDALLTISPINEVTNVVDQQMLRTYGGFGTAYVAPQSIPYTQELVRLALFSGSIDSSLELSPKLPFEDVSPGDTWQRTVNYLPQQKEGQEKSAVQRLDFTYTYDGIKEWKGKSVHQITGKLALDSNAAEILNQAMGLKPYESGLEELPLKMDSTITFWLDQKTKRTLGAEANSVGGWKLELASLNRPAVEQKITGKVSLTLAK